MCIILFFGTDGQKIAKKLSSGIGKEMKKIHTILEEFNAGIQLGGDHSLVSELLSPDADFWQSSRATTTSIPWSMQRKISQAYLLIRRTEEESCLLREEMQQVIAYWEVYIAGALLNYAGDESQAGQGAKALLHKLVWQVEFNLTKVKSAFLPIISLECDDPNLEPVSDDSSDDDDDDL